MTVKARILVVTLGLIALNVAGFFWLVIAPPEPDAKVREMPPQGQAAIGGGFTLVNHRGETVQDKDFHGKLMLVYFGFTHCPDICPKDVDTISKAITMLGDQAAQVAPIFITVDPERDTPERIKDFLKYFHPNMIGLTGSKEAVTNVQKAYKVYATKMDGKQAADYQVDHSALTYFMDKNGAYLNHFPPETKPEDMVKEIRKHL